MAHETVHIIQEVQTKQHKTNNMKYYLTTQSKQIVLPTLIRPSRPVVLKLFPIIYLL